MARYTAEHKEATRTRILKAAAKEFRTHGVEAATIPGIMQAADLTVGGFYKHFDSKAELFAEMVRETLHTSTNRLGKLKEIAAEEDWLAMFADEYLSLAHRENLRNGCVMAGLASDLPRASASAKQAYEDELLRDIDTIAQGMPGDNPEKTREKAWAFQALLLGGLVMARGAESQETAEEILAACRKEVLILGRE